MIMFVVVYISVLLMLLVSWFMLFMLWLRMFRNIWIMLIIVFSRFSSGLVEVMVFSVLRKCFMWCIRWCLVFLICLWIWLCGWLCVFSVVVSSVFSGELVCRVCRCVGLSLLCVVQLCIFWLSLGGSIFVCCRDQKCFRMIVKVSMFNSSSGIIGQLLVLISFYMF